MGWLDDVLAAIRPDTSQMRTGLNPWEEQPGDRRVPAGVVSSAPISPPGQPQYSYPIAPGPDLSQMAGAPQFEVSPFGPVPTAAPGPPPQMNAAPPIAGLNSPIGGGGAPFGIPPSVALASKMAAPPAPDPSEGQPGVPNLGGPFMQAMPSAPRAPATPPVMAQGGDATDVSARSRAVPLAAPVPEAAPSGSSFADVMRGFGPILTGVGGALSGDNGAATAAILKQRNDLALQTQQMNLTGNALSKAGAPPEVVAAAVRNPELMKAAIGQYFGKDKFKVVQTAENDRGRKTFKLMNEQDGTFKDIPGSTVEAESATEAAAAAGISGDSFLQTVPNAQDRSLVKQLTQYDLDPGKLSAKGGNRERLLALAEQYDPDYKAVLYAPRAALLKEFTSGGQTSPASIMTNGNTAIQHLGRMSELSQKLGGTNKGWILNGAINWANVTLEDMKNNPDLARFKGAQDRFVEEATKFYRGVGGNKADIDRALHILTAAQSPEARQAAIQEQAELMQSKVNALQDRFKNGMGPSGWKKALNAAGTEFPIVQEKSAKELDNIRRRASGETVADAPKIVKPGNYVWKNGALVAE